MTVALLLPLVFGLAACVLNDLCGNDVRSDLESPDRSRRAIVFVRDCGATTGFSTQVSVIWKGEKFGNESGNVFVADDDHGAVSEMTVRVRWEASDALVIQYPPKARIFFQTIRAHGTRIRYEPPER
jgi:hypothetical protein